MQPAPEDLSPHFDRQRRSDGDAVPSNPPNESLGAPEPNVPQPPEAPLQDLRAPDSAGWRKPRRLRGAEGTFGTADPSLRGGLEPAARKKGERPLIHRDPAELEREIKKTLPLGVELHRVYRYSIPLQEGTFPLLILKLFTPAEKESSLREWQREFERSHALSIVLDESSAYSGIKDQVRKWSKGKKLLTARHVPLVQGAIESFVGRPPRANGAIEAQKSYQNSLPDRTATPFLAIDGPSTKDREDMIQAERIPGTDEILLRVAYIDVTGFVAPRNRYDRYARRLGGSIYGTHVVIPTLGPEVAFGIGSFAPGEDRPAFVVEMRIGGDGKVLSSQIERSRVRCKETLTPEEVHTRLTQSEGGEPELSALREAAGRLRAARGASKGIVRLAWDEMAGDIVGESMVAAKTELAALLHRSGLPTVYRVHAPPTSETVALLIEKVAQVGVSAEREDFSGPLRLAALLRVLEEREAHLLVSEIIDTFLTRSRMDTVNRGHFALGVPSYIEIKPREAAGIANQFQLRALSDSTWEARSEGEMRSRARQRNRQRDEYDMVTYRLRFFERLRESLAWQGQSYDATIKEIDASGALVEAQEFSRWGVIPSSKRSRSFKVGDPVKVQLRGFNVEKMRFQFSLL